MKNIFFRQHFKEAATELSKIIGSFPPKRC
jgi:hypothetical protein